MPQPAPTNEAIRAWYPDLNSCTVGDDSPDRMVFCGDMFELPVQFNSELQQMVLVVAAYLYSGSDIF